MKNVSLDELIKGGPITIQPQSKAFPLTAANATQLTKDAGRQLIIDAIQAAANQQKYICELKELSEENEAALKESGFTVNRVEMMGGQTITVKWNP